MNLLMMALCLTLLQQPPPAPAATPGQGEPSVIVTQPDESKFPEITVYYELRRPDGSFILDAQRDEFRVSEDGLDRPILRFDAPITRELRPTTLVMVVDHSGSMMENNKLVDLKRAVATFLEDLPKGSKVAVIAFSSEVELICPLTDNYEQVQSAVDSLEANGGTRYYDAVTAALDLLSTQTGRRAVLALTDGKDARSLEATLRSTIVEARRLNLPVHTLGFGNAREMAVQELSRLAEETRGQHYLARDAASLRKIYEEFAQKLGSSYSLTYQTDRKVPDGTLRSIKIQYTKATQAGETAVFIRGMVVPQAGWSRLFLGLLVVLLILGWLPTFRRRKMEESPA